MGPIALADGRVHLPKGARGEIVATGPETSMTFCQVCNISFCGEIPAKQHYSGKKHAKKMKVYQFEEQNKAGCPQSKVSLTNFSNFLNENF